MVSLPLEGGCHCSAVRYRVSAPPIMIYNCHCTNCQKISGGAFATSAIIPETAFAFTKGAPKKVEWTSDAGNRRFGWFCGDCGSRIAHGQIPSSGVFGLRAGTLDDTHWIEPVGDIWTRSAQPWIKFRPDALTCKVQPTDYSAYIERFRAQGRFAS
jgi:hypothetical protein